MKRSDARTVVEVGVVGAAAVASNGRSLKTIFSTMVMNATWSLANKIMNKATDLVVDASEKLEGEQAPQQQPIAPPLPRVLSFDEYLARDPNHLFYSYEEIEQMRLDYEFAMHLAGQQNDQNVQ